MPAAPTNEFPGHSESIHQGAERLTGSEHPGEIKHAENFANPTFLGLNPEKTSRLVP